VTQKESERGKKTVKKRPVEGGGKKSPAGWGPAPGGASFPLDGSREVSVGIKRRSELGGGTRGIRKVQRCLGLGQTKPKRKHRTKRGKRNGFVAIEGG